MISMLQHRKTSEAYEDQLQRIEMTLQKYHFFITFGLGMPLFLETDYINSFNVSDVTIGRFKGLPISLFVRAKKSQSSHSPLTQ
jgi:hypothetical protein